MEISVTLGHDSDSDNGVCVTVADDNTYTPEVVADLLSRAGTEALRLHQQIHPVEADGGA